MDISKIKTWFQDSYGNQLFFHDEDPEQLKLSRIWGGISLPLGHLPGFAVLIAEERFKEMGFPDRRLHALLELEEADTTTLLQKVLDLGFRLQGIRWYGNLENPAADQLVTDFNRRQANARQKRIYLHNAPMLRGGNAEDFFRYALRRLQERTPAGRKTLDLRETPKVSGALASVPVDCAGGKGIESIPPVAALCFAVGALDYYGWHESTPASVDFDRWGDPIQSKKREYDPLNHFGGR